MRSDVPVVRAPQVPTFFSFSATSPSSNTMRCTLPSRLTSTSSRFDSALVTDTPTPCRPPENLYAASVALLVELAARVQSVNTSSTVGIFSSGCSADRNAAPVVRDRHRAVGVHGHVDARRVPPNASSAALSIASWMMWSDRSCACTCPAVPSPAAGPSARESTLLRTVLWPRPCSLRDNRQPTPCHAAKPSTFRPSMLSRSPDSPQG